MKVCPGCGVSVIDTAKFCVKCGFNIKKHEEEMAKECFCPECGTKFSGGVFCPECGYNVSEAVAVSDGGEVKEAVVGEVTESAVGGGDFGDGWLDGIADETDAAVMGKAKEALKAERAKGLAGMEFVEHSDGTYTVTKLSDKYAISVNIPKGVIAIGEGAFAGTDVVKVTLPEGLLQIDDRAFKSCKSLSEIKLPESLMIIGEEAFLGCEILELVIPESVRRVGKDAIKNTATERREAEAARKLAEEREKEKREQEKKRNAELFAQFCQINEVKDGVLVKYNGTDSRVVIPSGIREIGDQGFHSNSTVSEVVIPDTVTRIGWSAFYGSGITSINISNSVTYIGACAFAECTRLSAITVAGGNPAYTSKDGVLYTKDGKELVCYPSGRPGMTYTIPASVEAIGKCAFYKNSTLSTITIKSGRISIGVDAFYSATSLISIAIGNIGNIAAVADYAFYGCKNLTLRIPMSTYNQSPSNAFEGIKQLVKL